MIALSSTKSLKASIASALALGALATTPAFAQFNTTATVPTSDASGRVAAPATGNSQTLVAYQAAIAAAFAAGTGGDINFDNATIAGGTATVNTTSATATYGTTGSILTITQPNSIAAPDASGNGFGSYSTGVDTANVTSAGTNANYFGFSNVPTGTTIYNLNFNFSQNLSNFGIMVINRGAARNLTFTVNLSDGTSVTPTSAFPTSNGTLSFFQYSATGTAGIKSVNFVTTGYTRFDDLGFITAAAPAVVPEPSQFAGLGLGVLGLGVLALKARKRTLLGS